MRTIQRDIVGAFIFSGDNKLLLGKSVKGGVYPGCWLVPGGGVEPHETKLQAVVREVLEETGINISNAHIEQIAKVSSGQSEKVLRDTGERVLVNMRFYNFKVTLSDISDTVALAHEDDFTGARWFHTAELSELTLSPPAAALLCELGLLT